MNNRSYFSFEPYVDKNNIYNKPKDKKIYGFYQIATFPNPKNNKYCVRRFVVGSDNQFSEIKNYKLEGNAYKKLLKILPHHQYKLYNVYDFTDTNYPNIGDILITQSNTLSQSYDYYGNAPF